MIYLLIYYDTVWEATGAVTWAMYISANPSICLLSWNLSLSILPWTFGYIQSQEKYPRCGEGWKALWAGASGAPGEAVEMLRRGCSFVHLQFCQKLLEIPEHRIRNPGLSKESPVLFLFLYLYKNRKKHQGTVLTSFFRGKSILGDWPFHSVWSRPPASWRATRTLPMPFPEPKPSAVTACSDFTEAHTSANTRGLQVVAGCFQRPQR